MADFVHEILIVGFGNIGQGFFDLFNRKKDSLGLGRVRISEIVDTKYGHIQQKDFDRLPELKAAEKEPNVMDVIKDSSCDIVCEFTVTDYETGEPGFSHIKRSLSLGKSVITTNKGAVALHYDELVTPPWRGRMKFKGTVMSGTPSFNLLKLMPGITVTRFRGILSGTTNQILNEMSYGKSFSSSLKETMAKGIGDADPAYDVDGVDSAAKCSIVSRMLGWNHAFRQVETTGIRNVTSEDAKNGTKLIAYADPKVAYVKPVKLRVDDLLRAVSGVTNAIEFDTDTLGRIYSIGPGTGRLATAQAALSDLVELVE